MSPSQSNARKDRVPNPALHREAQVAIARIIEAQRTMGMSESHVRDTRQSEKPAQGVGR